MRWLNGTLGLVVLAACGDDDDTARVRLADAGVEVLISDAGADARPKPASVDPPDTIAPNPFWHVEHPPDSARTWLVSPAGARTFVLGVDSVFREDGCSGMSAYTRRAADAASRARHMPSCSPPSLAATIARCVTPRARSSSTA